MLGHLLQDAAQLLQEAPVGRRVPAVGLSILKAQYAAYLSTQQSAIR